MPPMSCRISSSCSASVSARSELPVYARMTAYMGSASFRLVYLESIGVSHDRAPMSRRKPRRIEVVLKQRHKHLRLRERSSMSPEDGEKGIEFRGDPCDQCFWDRDHDAPSRRRRAAPLRAEAQFTARYLVAVRSSVPPALVPCSPRSLSTSLDGTRSLMLEAPGGFGEDWGVTSRWRRLGVLVAALAAAAV